jgi:protein-L-isoaspartate(D-aspartate) O-methyltransferase
MSNAAANTADADWIDRVSHWVAQAEILNEDVEAHVRSAVAKVPRVLFAAPQDGVRALQDVDLQIGHGQWLHRPSLLIRMLSLIHLRKRMRVLVLGSGNGYMCAVCNAAGAQVFGVEPVAALAQASRKLLDSLGHHGVVVRRGDVNKGWDDAGPFDAIVVCYPVDNDLDLPLAQLRAGGTLVAPVISERGARLTVWSRSAEGYKRTVFEEVSCK